MENTSEIKSCPFCGNPATKKGEILYEIIHKFGCYIGRQTLLSKEAIYNLESWNTRTQSPESSTQQSKLVPLNKLGNGIEGTNYCIIKNKTEIAEAIHLLLTNGVKNV